MIPLLRAISGLILWAVAFSTLYALQGLGCALGWVEVSAAGLSLARVVLVLAYAAFLVLHVWLCRRIWPMRKSPRLLDRLALFMSVVGLVSTAYSGIPVVVTSTCT